MRLAGWPGRCRIRSLARPYDEAIVVTVGDHLPSSSIRPTSIRSRARPCREGRAAVAQLRLALGETGEFRDPGRLARAAVLAFAVTALYVAALSVVIHLYRRVAARLARSAERRLLRLLGGEGLLRVADARTTVQRAFTVVSFVLGALFTYAWLAIVLRRFPYTRPWGESLRGSLLSMTGLPAATSWTSCPVSSRCSSSSC